MLKSGLYLLLIILVLGCTNKEKLESDKLIPFEKDNKCGYMDEKGHVVLKPYYLIAGEFSPEGLAAVVDDTGWIYIDRNGKSVIRPFIYDNGPDPFKEGLARFVRDGKYGFFDKTGKIIISPKFNFARPFSENMAAVCNEYKIVPEDEHHIIIGGKWGYINKKGEIAITRKYEKATDFKNGKAWVLLDGKRININTRGEIVD